ncbi:MAG: tetratricopeptide repeat protein [Prevotella sp.]|nr:tetratricopeptide repeat protein [Prevotella sp.]
MLTVAVLLTMVCIIVWAGSIAVEANAQAPTKKTQTTTENLMAADNNKKEDKAERLLQEFNHHQSVATANSFFEELLKEGLLDEPMTFDQNTPMDTIRQQTWYWAAEHYNDIQQYKQSCEYAKRALPLCRVGNNRIIEADCLSLLAVVNIRQGYFKEAAKYAKECNELDMKSGDPDNISSSLNTLASIYMSMRQPQEAEHYILKAIEYSKKAGNERRLAIIYGIASEVYHHLEKDEESLSYATKAYDIEMAAGRLDKAAVRQSQRAAALINLERPEEAMKALNQAIPEFRQDGNLHSLAIACNQMGLLLRQQKKYPEALVYLNEALEIFIQQNDIYNEAQTHKALYGILKRTDPALAVEHMDRYESLRDSLYDRETGELLQKYAAEYGQSELEKLNEDERLSHRIKEFMALGVILLLLAAGWFVVRQYRRRAHLHTDELMAKIDQLQKQNADLHNRMNTVESEDAAEEKTGDEFLMQLVETVEKCMESGDSSVEAVAMAMNMSVSTMRRKLQTANGELPKTYITAIQMKKARQLLQTKPDITIAEVARLCGFTDATTFSRVFKRTYDVSPSKFLGNSI